MRTTPLESGSLLERKRKSRSPRKEGYLLGIPRVKLVVKRASEGDADVDEVPDLLENRIKELKGEDVGPNTDVCCSPLFPYVVSCLVQTRVKFFL